MFDSYCIPNDPATVKEGRFKSVEEVKAFIVKFLHRVGLTESDLVCKHKQTNRLKRYVKGVNVAAVRMALCYYIDQNCDGMALSLKRKAELAGYGCDHSAVKHVQKKATGYLKTNDTVFAAVWNQVAGME